MIISITGPSGVGKTTLLHNLRKAVPNARPLESITTRAARASDEPGEYAYVSEEEFEQIKNRGEFLWVAETYHHRYGTRKAAVDDALASGLFIPILVIDAAIQLYDYCVREGKTGAARFLYIHIGDEAELRRRLEERGDKPQEIAARIEQCRSWHAQAKHSSVPFIYLHATKTREEMAAKALASLRQ